MRVVSLLLIASSALLAVAWTAVESVGDVPPRDTGAALPQAKDAPREGDASPESEPSRDADPAAPSRPASEVLWSRDLDASLARARANDRLVLLYVAAPGAT